ncbi:unnamed protein product [Citrullus colocynthis]|uniref:Uncharacterized protein n=1 Tax=Citrullus colocynthis TaxID=252529 RepID=A0ABP0YTT0_9ROSI
MVGSLGNVYKSVQTLSDTYLEPGQDKDALLKPKASICCSTMTMLLPDIIDSSTTATTINLCNETSVSCCYSVSDGTDAICPTCKNYMDQVGTYVKPPSSNGSVKGVVSYMVMDDLSVSPMSTISSITLLNQLNIKDVGVLEEKLITLNVNERVKLLRASLQSKTVLTDVFLGNETL